ncbi:MAG: nickel pincer cofactor biosynthesis protein LarC [Synergistales bacterium]|nr:nickel pincer cofactor biosynthesis protein LarC [Synergistales bacterium]
MKILYLDCFAGISGDMFLGAMLDLGMDAEAWKRELSKIPLPGYSVLIERSSRNHISGTKVTVISEEGHPHRRLRDITGIISGSGLSEFVRKSSLQAFRILAEAEGKVHDKNPDEIHFHEVGAVDSIVDIVGAFILLEMLKPDRIIASPVNTGSGMVECAHGSLPVPAPATLELLQGIPVFSTPEMIERTTPTGALLLRSMTEDFSSLPEGFIHSQGYGLGTKETPGLPNLLRAVLLEYSEKTGPDLPSTENALIIETNIDDMNPQVYDTVMESLFSKGAMDAWLTSITMKKGRPAIKISCLCSEEDLHDLMNILLKETTTLGLRIYEVNKFKLEPKFRTLETRFGRIVIKEAWWGGEKIKEAPEYEDLKKISREKQIPLVKLYEEIHKDLK